MKGKKILIGGRVGYATTGRVIDERDNSIKIQLDDCTFSYWVKKDDESIITIY